ncbi:hypothetical protein WA026_014199 [Henosepilachna vigintioctopunctata]|uniref:Retroviral polymerase SH3-like domain-containing protein n=1 Tax=Henosepilachna vigintioctopunctata TaxID=420089 RepID=A0AAW1TLY2_9CUCU
MGNSPQNNSSPYQVWFKKDCNIEIFKEFGSKVIVHVPKQKRFKLDPKNRLATFMGYTEETKDTKFVSGIPTRYK